MSAISTEFTSTEFISTESGPVDVAALIRAASADDHRATESRGFITRLMGGELSLGDYARYLAQYAHVYEALESRAQVGPEVFDPRLARFARIESDLVALGVTDWRADSETLPGTVAYVERLRELVGSADELDSTVRYLAHHYSRYLGDLSGGQAIAALMVRHYGATAEQLSFYDFSELGSPVQAKRDYRERMNALGLDEAAIAALVDEVGAAFRFNGRIFDELDARTGADLPA